jgi:two-component system, OmpR family, response regulator
VVDDDPAIRRMLTRYFEDEGFRVSTAESGPGMRTAMAKGGVDVVLLDLVLPGEDGIQLARELRASSKLGIIMLTGRTDIVDRVVGLEVGADDYIPKPFHLREVHARVKSVLRRIKTVPATPPTGSSDELAYRFEGWRLEATRRQLIAPSGQEVSLTTGEFDLLLALVQRPGRVLDRDTLMELTRGRDWEAFDRSVDAQVSRLRKKIETDPADPKLVKSVRGVGYVFAARVHAD